jgi:3-oxoacyl-[acyl-carrier protein] reductase
MDFTGRVALITGAGSGMGRAHALTLAERGARVAVNDVDAVSAEATARLARERGAEALATPCDVSDSRAVNAMVETVGRTLGRLDILVNNAGIADDAVGIEATTDAAWRRTFAVHLGGMFYCSRAALPWLRQSPVGRIINVSSMWGQAAHEDSHAYSAAKAAILGFSRSLAKELAKDRICVNAIAPGHVFTPMLRPRTAAELAAEHARIPLRRWAQPEEISYLVAFLASDEAAFITGQTIPINGGELIVGL